MTPERQSQRFLRTLANCWITLRSLEREKTLTEMPAPCIAIPTTAGTGAEVTRNAVLGSPEHGIKVSMRSPWMLPDLALVDPELTFSMPPAVTASTGLDALTQVMEPFVSINANPLTDGICREGLLRAGRSLRAAFEDGNNKEARVDMSVTSLFGGLALANAKLGAVHGFAATLAGMYKAPHGVVCAGLLPYVMEMNVRALKERQPDSFALDRYSEIARILTGNINASARDGVTWVKELCSALDIPPLSKFGVAEKDFPEIVELSQKASSMKGNPISLTDDELSEIMQQAI